METDGQERWWFDASALTERSALARLRGSGKDVLGQFAEANGLRREPDQEGTADSFGVWERSAIDDLVAFAGHPEVEFGNYGSKYSLSLDYLPARFGYIAVRHGLDLPLVVAGFKGLVGAKTVANVTSMAINVLGAFDTQGDPVTGPYDRFRSEGVEILQSKKDGVAARSAKGAEAAARELLTGPAVAELADLTRSYTVEIRPDWMYAYSFYGDLCTTDPEVWAWAFSCASRMIDLASLWRQGWPPVDASVPVRPPDLREIPFYTPQRVPRPGKVDGVFSKASVTRLKRDR